MKLYFFQETGEFRITEDEEWYRDSNGDFIQSEGPSILRHPIVVMTEIDTNDKTWLANLVLYQDVRVPIYNIVYIPIVRPEAKVKKWQWLFQSENCDKIIATEHWYTESEVKDIFKNRRMKLLKKIEESEVELEESKNDIKE